MSKLSGPLQGIDERFLRHRQRSSSIAGLAGAAVAGGLFFYDLLVRDTIAWDLFAVLATIAIVKTGLFVLYRITD